MLAAVRRGARFQTQIADTLRVKVNVIFVLRSKALN